VNPDMVAALCCLADEFQNATTEISMGTLLSRTGFSMGDPISEEAIEAYLRDHPELVNWWLLESRNTRGTPAWYIHPPQFGSEWIVSHAPDETKYSFPDKFKACAFYVRVFVMQLASLRSATYYGRPPKYRQESF